MARVAPGLEERRARAEALLADPERAALVARMAAARTLPEVAAARAALIDWCRRHPGDQGILAGGERLERRWRDLTAGCREREGAQP